MAGIRLTFNGGTHDMTFGKLDFISRRFESVGFLQQPFAIGNSDP